MWQLCNSRSTLNLRCSAKLVQIPTAHDNTDTNSPVAEYPQLIYFVKLIALELAEIVLRGDTVSRLLSIGQIPLSMCVCVRLILLLRFSELKYFFQTRCGLQWSPMVFFKFVIGGCFGEGSCKCSLYELPGLHQRMTKKLEACCF